MTKKEFKENIKLTLKRNADVWFFIGCCIADLKATDKETDRLINKLIKNSIK